MGIIQARLPRRSLSVDRLIKLAFRNIREVHVFEWRAFVSKLTSPQAVFIYEPDPALARMALGTCDLATLLRVADSLRRQP